MSDTNDTNDINFEGTDGDVRGHVYKSGRIDAAAGADAEGHSLKSHIDDGSDDDSQGHSARRGGIDDGSGDDAEGHIDTDLTGDGPRTPGKPKASRL